MSAAYGYDPDRGLLVILRGKGESDDEYAEILRRTERLDRDASGKRLDPVCIAVLGADAPAPNAHWRRKFAESASSGRCKRTFAGVVTQSAIMRGVLNAIRWLKADDGNNTTPYATFEEACVGAERFRGEPLPELRRLMSVARAELDGASTPSARSRARSNSTEG